MSEPYLHLSGAAAATAAVSSRGRSSLSRSHVRTTVVRILWARLHPNFYVLWSKKYIAGVDGRASPIREEKEIMIEFDIGLCHIYVLYCICDRKGRFKLITKYHAVRSLPTIVETLLQMRFFSRKKKEEQVILDKALFPPPAHCCRKGADGRRLFSS